MITRFLPKSLVGQLLLAVAVALLAGQIINFWIIARERSMYNNLPMAGLAAARLVDASEILRDRALPPDREAPTIARFRGQRFIHSQLPPALPPRAQSLDDLSKRVEMMLDDAGIAYRDIRSMAVPPVEKSRRHRRSGRGILVVSMQKSDGTWVSVRGRLPAKPVLFQKFLLGQTAFLYLLLLGPILWIGWRVSRPLSRLTAAVRGSLPGEGAKIASDGPRDVRDLIVAFNGYQDRLSLMLADKDRMLGAIGHDLRTPLASLRVRVEAVDDVMLRDKMIASVEQMSVMLTDMLLLARGSEGLEARALTDLNALVEALVTEYRDLNRSVDDLAKGPQATTAVVRPLMLSRALRNLIDNAIAYGNCARLSVQAHDGCATIIVSDDGPGLSAEDIKRFAQPFARGEMSRNRETGGSGLGLALAKMIVEAEGGRLTLANRAGGGLDASIALPQT